MNALGLDPALGIWIGTAAAVLVSLVITTLAAMLGADREASRIAAERWDDWSDRGW